MRTSKPIEERVPTQRSRPERGHSSNAPSPPDSRSVRGAPSASSASGDTPTPRPRQSGSLRSRGQGRIQRPGRPQPNPRIRAGGPPNKGNPDIIAQALAQAQSGGAASHDDPEGRAKDLLERAQTAAQNNKWKAAYRSLKNARELDPQNAGVLTWLAWVTYHLPYDDRDRQYRVCRDQLQAALVINPRQPEAFYFTGYMAEEHFDVESAAEAYARALKLNPSHVEARARLEALRKHQAQNPNKGDGKAKKMFNRLMDWLDE